MVRIPAGGGDYSHLQSVQTGSGTRGPSQVVKQPGCRADHSPQLKNEWNYTSTPHTYFHGVHNTFPFTCTLGLDEKMNKWKIDKAYCVDNGETA